MSHLLDENEELLASPAREMTLGTGSILAIFFGLALLCALFFGFGYNVGHKSATAALLPAPSEATTSAPPVADTFKTFKPATPKAAPAAVSEPASVDGPDPATPTASAHPLPAASSSGPATHPQPTAHPGSPAKPSAASLLPARAVPSPTPAAPQAPSALGVPALGTFLVQVAAVSHPEDASLLMGALRARGYAVAQHTEAADKLIHIQVGPFASKPAAEAMRQRLLADGYNAIIK